jgi:hypothetical protein
MTISTGQGTTPDWHPGWLSGVSGLARHPGWPGCRAKPDTPADVWHQLDPRFVSPKVAHASIAYGPGKTNVGGYLYELYQTQLV